MKGWSPDKLDRREKRLTQSNDRICNGDDTLYVAHEATASLAWCSDVNFGNLCWIALITVLFGVFVYSSHVSRRRFCANGVVLAGGALFLSSVPQLVHSAELTQINGTGGSAATRILSQWNFLSAKEQNIEVRYATAVSDVGIREIIARHVDFACSEIPLSPRDLKKNDLLQFPLLIGGVVVVVNVPGVETGQMRLNADLLAEIYLGKIRSWDDQEIKNLNPSLKLPKMPVRLVGRSQPASTTLAFTTHLAKNSRAWASSVGISKLPVWPVQTEPAASTQAMGEKVKSIPGSIGYLNFDEAFRGGLAVTQLKNLAGNYLVPGGQSFQNTAISAGVARAGEQLPLLIDVKGAQTWPIVYVTYVLLDRHPKNVAKARLTLKFFYGVFLRGDAMAAESGFVPMPTSSQARSVGSFRDILGPNNTPIEYLS